MQNIHRLNLPDLAGRAETSRAASDFVNFAKFIALAGNPIDAVAMAESRSASERVVTVLRSAVGMGTTGDAGWAGNLAAHGQMASAFLESLSGRGVFDTLYGSMLPVPMNFQVAISTAAVEGDEIGEGVVTPITSLSFVPGQLPGRRVQAIVVVTRELLEAVSVAGQRMFDVELRKAIIRATDTVFLGRVLNGVTPVPSSGNTGQAAINDLAALLLGVAGSDQAAYFLITTGDVAKRMTVLSNGDGTRTFPEMSPLGGRALGMPVMVSDSLAAGSVVLIDATQVGADRGELVFDSARHAALQMSDAPMNGATNLVSLWQTGAAALRAQRWIAAERLRDDAVAVLDGVAWGESVSGS